MSPITIENMKHLTEKAVALRAVALILCVSSSVAGAEVWQNSGTTCSALRFVVVDLYGSAIPYRLSAFDSRAKSWLSAFQGLHSDCLPTGTYSYRLERADVRSAYGQLLGTVEIAKPHQWLTLVADPTTIVGTGGAIAVDSEMPKGFFIKGRVDPPPTGPGPHWVRIQSAYTAQFADAPVDAEGNVMFRSYLQGSYVAVVYYDGKVVAAKPLLLKEPRPVTFRIEVRDDQ